MPSAILTPWQSPSADDTLARGGVHLWRFRLNKTRSESLLSAEEVQRMQRFRVPEKAGAFAVTRTRLRQILGRYLNISAQDIAFSFNKHGKPFLPGKPVHFNVSHSGTWGVCAITMGGEIGVDLEYVNPGLEYAPLARRFFSANEYQWLISTVESRRRRSFFRLWTRKEAWLKGRGGGFSEITLELDSGHLSATASMEKDWWLMNLPVARGYVGALAVAGGVERVARWTWDM